MLLTQQRPQVNADHLILFHQVGTWVCFNFHNLQSAVKLLRVCMDVRYSFHNCVLYILLAEISSSHSNPEGEGAPVQHGHDTDQCPASVHNSGEVSPSQAVPAEALSACMVRTCNKAIMSCDKGTTGYALGTPQQSSVQQAHDLSRCNFLWVSIRRLTMWPRNRRVQERQPAYSQNVTALQRGNAGHTTCSLRAGRDCL